MTRSSKTCQYCGRKLKRVRDRVGRRAWVHASFYVAEACMMAREEARLR